MMRLSGAATVFSLVWVGFSAGCGSSPDSPAPLLGPTSGYPGDELALVPPDASEGFQVHYGPKDYTGQAMADYLLGPGQEDENCYMSTTPNDQEVFVNEYTGRMRPGSHHLILWG